METATSDEHQQKLISYFMEIAVGQTMESAILFLKATSWNLEEAINLFLIHRHNQQPLSNQNSSKQQWSDYQEEEEQIPLPLPLPSIRDILYGSSSMYQTPAEVCPEEIWDSKPEPSDSASVGSGDSRLSSLYRPPLKLLFQGSFEDAKSTSSQENLWLLVNLQSTTEFASHTLNRDLWSNDAVSQAIESSFLLWQVYDDTTEGRKISTFYKIESAPPVVLVIDPITGQKMRMWSGQIEAQSFVEDLSRFMEAGPHEHIASLTRNRRVETKEENIGSSSKINDQVPAPSWGEEFEKKETWSSSNNNKIVAPSWGEEFEKEETCSSSNNTNKTVAPLGEGFEYVKTWSSSNNYDHIVAPSWGPEFEESAEVKEEEETCLEFPDLTEEPKGDCDRSVVCSLCVRFPDGRRKQRRFLKSEPVQLLWSFCYSHMEASEKKAFKLVQAIPGASKTLDYGANTTFDQSGLANSMISVTWE